MKSIVQFVLSIYILNQVTQNENSYCKILMYIGISTCVHHLAYTLSYVFDTL